MAITKFVWVEFDRAVQEELFDIKFIGFGEGLVTVFLQNTETCKNAYKSNGNNFLWDSHQTKIIELKTTIDQRNHVFICDSPQKK